MDGGSYLELTATNDGSEWVSVTVLSETTRVPVGTYTLDDGSPFSILSVYNLNSEGLQQNYTATKGTAAPEDAFMLDIEKISNSEASGTFSGTLVSVEGLNTTGIVTFTNGKFKLPLNQINLREVNKLNFQDQMNNIKRQTNYIHLYFISVFFGY